MAPAALIAWLALLVTQVGLTQAPAPDVRVSPEAAAAAHSKTSLERQLVEDQQRESRAQEALNQAQAALAAAKADQDDQALPVATEAVQVATAALQKARGRRTQDERALAEVAAELGWKTGGAELAGISSAEGAVYKRSSMGWVPLDPQTPLQDGDVVATGPDGRMTIKFGEESGVDLGTDSTFTVDKTAGSPALLSLLRGRLHVRLNCLKNHEVCSNNRFRVSSVTAAVRGTEFLMETPREHGPSILSVIHGTVELREPGSGRTVFVGNGQRVTITPAGVIGVPAPVDTRSLPHWWEKSTS